VDRFFHGLADPIGFRQGSARRQRDVDVQRSLVERGEKLAAHQREHHQRDYQQRHRTTNDLEGVGESPIQNL
jgi:hypothetical protein